MEGFVSTLGRLLGAQRDDDDDPFRIRENRINKDGDNKIITDT